MVKRKQGFVFLQTLEMITLRNGFNDIGNLVFDVAVFLMNSFEQCAFGALLFIGGNQVVVPVPYSQEVLKYSEKSVIKRKGKQISIVNLRSYGTFSYVGHATKLVG